MESLEKTIFVFDVCSSTTIVEDLHRTGSVKHYNDMIKSLNDYLEEKSKKLKFYIYKFIGDGFILTFPGEIEIETILRFAKDLIDTCNQKITKLMEYMESLDLPRKGITIGLDKGIIHQFDLNAMDEYVGRALTLACRLQSSQNKPEQVNSILISVKVYSEIKDKKIKQSCEQRERTFKNITGDKAIKCYELFPLKLDFQEIPSKIEDMAIDTIIVPARGDGFNRTFLKKNCWYAIRISKSMIGKIKYIAAYQVAPISAITHYAEVSHIEEYQKTGKYIVHFKDSAKEIKPIKLIPKGKVKAPQAPRYTNFKKLLNAKNLDDIEIKDSESPPRLPIIKESSKESKEPGIKKKEISSLDLMRYKFWEGLLKKSKEKTKLHTNISPSMYHWIGASAGKRGLGLHYGISKNEGTVELYIDRGKDSENKEIFDQLFKNKTKIENTFGKSLTWKRLDEKRACRINFKIKIGGYRDEERYPEIHDAMIDAMIRLEKSLRPHIAKLKI
jgi:class 3 adenylate cyclase